MDRLNTIIEENRKYWTQRAKGYSEYNMTEFGSECREKWKNELLKLIGERFGTGAEYAGAEAGTPLKVLDIGTGPGVFAVRLAEEGFDVTAADLTPSMLDEARANAGGLAEKITFLEMNAESLLFPEESFDIIVSRNLTWNLPHPGKAYAEWTRVLKNGGLLLNFDANWYHYLFNEEALKAYENDRSAAAEKGIRDENIGENFDVMEDIARRVPLSRIKRPEWDIKLLGDLGLKAEADTGFGEKVLSEEDKISFASTPMFMIKAVKEL